MRSKNLQVERITEDIKYLNTAIMLFMDEQGINELDLEENEAYREYVSGIKDKIRELEAEREELFEQIREERNEKRRNQKFCKVYADKNGYMIFVKELGELGGFWAERNMSREDAMAMVEQLKAEGYEVEKTLITDMWEMTKEELISATKAFR